MVDKPGHGDEDLWNYWLRGPGAAKIAWGTPRDFTRCVALVGKYVPPNQVKGYCAKLHHASTGMWPGDSRNQ